MEKETQNRPVRQEFCKLGHGEQGEGQGWAGPLAMALLWPPAPAQLLAPGFCGLSV